MSGYIGVDLDGTLAIWNGWIEGIGEPIPLMVQRVKNWIARGTEVRIITARACLYVYEKTSVIPELNVAEINRIQDWTEKHIGKRLSVQFWKDYEMLELWDDRARQVKMNTGILIE